MRKILASLVVAGALLGVAASAEATSYVPKKAWVCHTADDGQQFSQLISLSAVPSHLAKGDTLGFCPVP